MRGGSNALYHSEHVTLDSNTPCMLGNFRLSNDTVSSLEHNIRMNFTKEMNGVDVHWINLAHDRIQ